MKKAVLFMAFMLLCPLFVCAEDTMPIPNNKHTNKLKEKHPHGINCTLIYNSYNKTITSAALPSGVSDLIIVSAKAVKMLPINYSTPLMVLSAH
ncbi:MAG: hypothetical protein LBD73_03220 [Deferribacteraceae bacterium]|jgi:hypothetical protein|nr:hypothetical protein [Deferribacteraceae bacterium]